jgi:hypothetical protein
MNASACDMERRPGNEPDEQDEQKEHQKNEICQ